MRLVLTRAMADAVRTRETLEARGHQVILSPVIEMVGTGAAWASGVFDAVLATSAHAFEWSFSGLQPEARRLMPLYLVGRRTEAAARAAGFLGPARVAGIAAGLAKALDRRDHRPRRMIYLAGRDRKPDIETALAAMGQAVDVVEVYEARETDALSAPAAKAFRQYAVDATLHYSQRSAALFLAAARRADVDITRAAHLCLSEDVARPVREAACPTIRIAATPKEVDLLDLVETLRGHVAGNGHPERCSP